MPRAIPDYREILHSPADVASEFIQWAEMLQDSPGVPFGIPAVDEKVIPFHPGDMVVICGRPGSGKTSMLAFLARSEAKRIVARGKAKTEAVVYITFEQIVEEIEATFQASTTYTASDLVRGKVNIDEVKRSAIKRVMLPIWIVGDSLSRTNSNSPRLYPDVVFRAIETMYEDHNTKPTLLCLDYIQLIPIPHQSDRQRQVLEAAHQAKELAKRVGCPVVVAVQARREVDTRDIKIPGLWDAQWSSGIEQAADKFFSLWRPWLTEPHFNDAGSQNTIRLDGKRYPVTKELLIMAMVKQRFEDGRWTWPLFFDPRYLKLCELETDVEEPIAF